MASKTLYWLTNIREVKVSYGRISSLESNEVDITGDKDNVNIGGFLFHLRFSRPSIRERMTYSLGLIIHHDTVCSCEGNVVDLSKREGDRSSSLKLRMDTESEESDKITYCFVARQGSSDGILWIDFNFPFDKA
ncbi:unnamed protein product [Allacma fusca]|uniref:Uncharacterized protein n=1 Tax=Allacma fusca TaxID=39272 RepID=A0A8J2P9V3_9HEXA|nr:unnamed protein product [Allacma fusca]